MRELLEFIFIVNHKITAIVMMVILCLSSFNGFGFRVIHYMLVNVWWVVVDIVNGDDI